MNATITLPLLGLIVGSWLGVVVRRWPLGRAIAWARSQCDSCSHVLGASELVPLLSFAVQRGRCRHCEARIGWFHPCIELAALCVAVVALLVDGGNGPRAWIDAALGWALLCAAWIDAENCRLPDVITLPLLLAGLAVTYLDDPTALYGHAVAAALGYLGFRLLDALYRLARGRDGLGQGDAKLLAAAGAWLGLAALPWVITGAGVAGIVLALVLGRRGDQPVPFGPPLALAFFTARLWGG
ncbi:prepilin peptidase [Acidocella aromatica]|uniref:Prepilin leader peptidase/N-methyltransferase n=1 Tax=Acidocella aromatica TaxID=1303579 RepID=A0A840VG81_9PROT|nr:leader peptidase (prepilin peptidase)/N-methyltransferase [Acidocella aromatica]